MACDKKTRKVKVEPSKIAWGREQVVCFTPVFPVVESSHILISTPTDSYYIWQNDGAGVDPLIPSRTGIEIDTSAAISEAQVADAWVTQLEADGTFYAKLSSDGLSLEIENKDIGQALVAPSDGDTTGTVEEEVAGIGGDLGCTSGPIELTITTDSIDLTADQTAGTILDKFVNAQSISAAMDLLEMTEEKWSLIVGNALGGEYTPAAGTKLVGMGLDSVSKSYFDVAGKLVFHPVRLPSTDRSRDLTFWKSAPDPSSYNFSSQDAQVMGVTFDSLPDEDVRGEINIFAFGDHKQDVRA